MVIQDSMIHWAEQGNGKQKYNVIAIPSNEEIYLSASKHGDGISTYKLINNSNSNISKRKNNSSKKPKIWTQFEITQIGKQYMEK